MNRTILFVAGLALGTTLGLFLSTQFSSPSPPPPPSKPAPPQATQSQDEGERVTAPAAAKPEAHAEPAVLTREAAPNAQAATFEVDPSFGTLVYGTATSRDGTPIDSCRLSFRRANDKNVRVSASIEEGHGYAVTGLSPGMWKVYGKPEDHAALQSDVEILEAPSQRLDLTFEPSFLVTVKMQTPDGQPLSKAIAEAKLGYYTDVIAVVSKRPFAGNLPMTELRSHSRFGVGSWRGARGFSARNRKPVAAEIAGTLEMTEPPPLFVAAVFRHVVLASETIEAGEKEVVLTVSMDKIRESLSTIMVQVMDASTGLPIPKARVGISDSQSGGGGQQTDEQGRIKLENERVGILELDIYAKGFGQHHQLLRLAPGENDLGVIRMHPAKEISVSVVGPDGEPAAGVTIQYQNLDLRTFPQPSMYRRSSRTDADGSVKLGSLTEGTYLVQAFERGKSYGQAVVNTMQLAEGPTRITLANTLQVNVEAKTGTTRTSTECLTIYDGDRTPVWARWWRGGSLQVPLPAGNYTWELHGGTTLVKNGSFELRDGAEVPTIRTQ